MTVSESRISTLGRVCDILNCFGEEHELLTLTEIARCVALPKSTVHRILTGMECQGMINRDPYGRGFQLGYQLVRWGILAQLSINLRNIALPVMRTLVKQTSETAVLSVRYGNTAIWIETVESDQPVRIALRTGKPLSLHAGASSKILWAFLPEDEIERILGQIDLRPIQVNTITDRQHMLHELKVIRNIGYAVSNEETDQGAMGIAAPVYDHQGNLTAGIGIVAPTSRVTMDKVPAYAQHVLEAGYSLSQRMGATMPAPSTK
jgi:IclR family KDG regulon transcriptional repressor